MRILLGYSYYQYPYDVKQRTQAWLARLRAQGISVEGFCLTINPPGPPLWWRALEKNWCRGDRELLTIYERLARRLEQFDVFINYNGINLHPDFITQLPTFNVYACFDDPESSEDLSKPVATAYDLCLVGNIAEVDKYKKWGVENAKWWPLGFREDDYDPCLTENSILTIKRSIEISLLCEKVTRYRQDRLEAFVEAFPQGEYYGKGWSNGLLPQRQAVQLYKQTKIGPNFHNSTGPVNFRTFILPANGVLQICDNRSYLGKIFELGTEVIGFDSIKEAIELCRYYLAHEEERRRIAAHGWARAIRDYNELAVFKRAIGHIESATNRYEKRKEDIGIFNFKRQHRRTALNRGFYHLKDMIKKLYSMTCRLIAYPQGFCRRSKID